MLYFFISIKSHLGNNRIVANASGTVVQRNSFYPFGMAYGEESDVEQGKQPYKYNGKELDKMHGLNQYDYVARFMDPAKIRFTTVDPLAESFYSWSPYVYTFNNPLKFIDPDGKFPIIPIIIVAYLLLESQPVNAPTGNPNDTGLKDAWSNYNNSVATSLIPIGPPGAGKAGTSVILQVAKEGGEKAVSKVVKDEVKEKTHQTYTKARPIGKKDYSGRTNGTGTPLENVAKRDKKHHMNDKGYGPAKLDKSSKNPDPIRGREQQLIKKNGGAQSTGGTSGNKINRVSPKNPKASDYDNAATKEFGEL